MVTTPPVHRRVNEPSDLCSGRPAAAIATFEDANLEAAVRFALSVSAQSELTCGLVSGLTSLDAEQGGITSLVGIQNLTSIDNLEHGLFANSEYTPGKRPDECPPGFRNLLADLDVNGPEVQATFRDMVDSGVAMTSTLVVYEMSVSERPPIDERVFDVLAPEIAEEVREISIQRREGQGAIDPAVFAKAMEYERAFVDAGGLLAAGVDPTGYGAAPPGLGDQRNYELLLEAGFSAPESSRS